MKESIDQRISKYKAIMIEVRERLHQVDQLFRAENVHIQIRAESGYLQTRLIIENIAQACLIAHIDLPGFINADIKKSHEADKIIKRLIQRYPNGFIKPIRIKNEIFGKIVEENRDDKMLSYQNILKIYTECGNILHARSAKRRANGTNQIKDINENISNLSKIHFIIQHHYIAFSQSHIIICQFGAEKNEINISLVELDQEIIAQSDFESRSH